MNHAKPGSIALLLVLQPWVVAGAQQPEPPAQPPTMEFCELVASPAFFTKTVRLQATYVVTYEDSFFYDPSCNTADLYAWDDQDFPHPDDTTQRERLAEVLLASRDKYGAGRALLAVTAVFEAFDGVGFGALGEFRQRLRVLEIENIAAVAPDEPWPWDTRLPGPLSDATVEIRRLDVNWHHALSNGDRLSLEAILDPDFVMEFPAGVFKNKQAAVEEAAVRMCIGSTVLQSERVFVNGQTAVALGRLSPRGHTVDGGGYINVFRAYGDEWRLMLSRLDVPECSHGDTGGNADVTGG